MLVLLSMASWGVMGVMIGLVLALVGILPMRILTSTPYADWYCVIGLVLGSGLVFGIHRVSLWVGALVEADEEASGAHAKSTAEPVQIDPLTSPALCPEPPISAAVETWMAETGRIDDTSRDERAKLSSAA
jgi:hypothetical protein